MKGNSHSLRNCSLVTRIFLTLLVAFTVVFTVPGTDTAQAQQRNVTVETICGNLNASWPDIEAVFASIMAMINQAIQSMAQIGVGVGIGDIKSCLPDINFRFPTINLENCFSFGANFNCNLNIQLPNLQQCLDTALRTLQNYLNQYNVNINMQELMNCLSGLINVNVTIPDVLAIVNGLLNSILGLLNSLTASITWYSDVFHFFINFCGNNANGGIGGGACGTTSGTGGSFNNSITGGGGSISININPFGATASQTSAQGSAASDRYSVFFDIRDPKTKKYLKKNIAVPCGSESCRKTYRSLSAKKYKGKKLELVVSIYPLGGNETNALPIAESYSTVTY